VKGVDEGCVELWDASVEKRGVIPEGGVGESLDVTSELEQAGKFSLVVKEVGRPAVIAARLFSRVNCGGYGCGKGGERL
jgi:hypothetical protein